MQGIIKMTVVMEVTEPQAIALQEMFNYWTYLGNIGSSRKVGFYVDGDGDFQPNCKCIFNAPITNLSQEDRDKAIIKENDGNRLYDFDPIGWLFIKSN